LILLGFNLFSRFLLTSGKIKYILIIDMGRKKTTQAGRTTTFFLGEPDLTALRAFRRRHGYSSDSAALRVILQLVAETEGSDGKEENNVDCC